MNTKAKRKAQLGMDPGTAQNRLRKALLFYMAQQLNMETCYRCSKTIINESEFSIEHKEAWLDSNNPVDKFFNLDNIAFSHLSCNIGAGKKPNKISWPDGQAWCSGCQQMKPLDNFTPNKSTKRNANCKVCKLKQWHSYVARIRK